MWIAGDGSFDFTPATNFTGDVTFTYQASDGNGVSNVATVTITVNAPPEFKIFLPVVFR